MDTNALTQTKTIQVSLKGKPETSRYCIGRGLLTNLGDLSEIQVADEVLLCIDENVHKLHRNSIEQSLKGKTLSVIVIKPGEAEKNLDKLPEYIKSFASSRIAKKTVLVAIGGGVITDLGGFIASILYRGIPAIYVPTTLLSQVDAAIGGKTGVNVNIGESTYKNMVGTVTQPKVVLSDIDVLKTLPEKELINGLGELLKYTIGWGTPSLELLKKIKNRDIDVIEEAVHISQRVKLKIITKDPNDKKHIRESLNFGHTVGHALEAVSKGRLSHGQAVSIGLVASLHISKSLSLISEEKYKEYVSQIVSLGLPTKIEAIEKSEVKKAMLFDKKGGTFVLLTGRKTLKTGISVSDEVIDRALSEVLV